MPFLSLRRFPWHFPPTLLPLQPHSSTRPHPWPRRFRSLFHGIDLIHALVVVVAGEEHSAQLCTVSGSRNVLKHSSYMSVRATQNLKCVWRARGHWWLQIKVTTTAHRAMKNCSWIAIKAVIVYFFFIYLHGRKNRPLRVSVWINVRTAVTSVRKMFLLRYIATITVWFVLLDVLFICRSGAGQYERPAMGVLYKCLWW